MSYSFQLKAATTGALLALAQEEVARIAAYQPVHSIDSKRILAGIETQLDMLAPCPGKDVGINCSGYLSWTGTPGHIDFEITACHFSCSVTALQRQVEPEEPPTHVPV